MNFKTIIIIFSAFFHGSRGYEYEDTVSLLNGENRLEILGDKVTIESKNETDVNYSRGDAIDQYFENHYLRIKLFDEVMNVDLKDFLVFQKNDLEGRAGLKKALLPILLALKLKLAIVVPIFMSVIALIAIKGLLSGMASLVILKIMALKALLRHHHDHFDHHDHYDHHDHSHHNVHEYWSRDDNDKSYIVYFPGERQRIRASNRDETYDEYKTNYPYQWGKDDTYQWEQFPSTGHWN